jgi:hypothetical protein
MLSQYEKELCTHYAQVRKRLREGPPKKPPEPVKEPEPEKIPDFVLYVNKMPLVRTLVYSKRDFVVIENEAPAPRKSFQDVLKEVSHETGIAARMLIGNRRHRYLCEARQMFFYRVAIECPHLSIADIGRRAGRDHTTVLHGLKRHAERFGLPYARGGVE